MTDQSDSNAAFAKKMAVRRYKQTNPDAKICPECSVIGKPVDRSGLCIDCTKIVSLTREQAFVCTKKLSDYQACFHVTGIPATWCEPCKRAVKANLVKPTTRQSGRTTELLRRAVSAAQNGKNVVYVVANQNHIPTCLDLIRQHIDATILSNRATSDTVRFGKGRLKFQSIDRANAEARRGTYEHVIKDHTVEPRAIQGSFDGIYKLIGDDKP